MKKINKKYKVKTTKMCQSPTTDCSVCTGVCIHLTWVLFNLSKSTCLSSLPWKKPNIYRIQLLSAFSACMRQSWCLVKSSTVYCRSLHDNNAQLVYHQLHTATKQNTFKLGCKKSPKHLNENIQSRQKQITISVWWVLANAIILSWLLCFIKFN